jgi:hypothetical protein
MKHLLTASALAAMFVVGGIYASQHVAAQNNEPCVGENCPAPDMQGNQGQNKKRMKGVDQNNQMQGPGDESQTGEQTMPRKKRAGNQQNNNNDVDVDVRTRVDAGSGSKWHYDPSRHQRRHSKSATFRFYYGGYWYPQPYWEIYTVRPRRVSCGEGRAIVAERFNRVRVVECNGGTYTYLGRRQGDTFRILLNARTGRIVGRALI